MSNYTKDNLILVDKALLKPGMLAWSDGHNIFVFPSINNSTEPAYSMYFYKCASVNNTTKTWNGYRAILSNGVYSFSETLTENLSYGAGFTPSVGKIYNDDATVSISGLWSGLPSDGLVFYAPLSANASAAETGQALSTHSGEVTYTTANGIPCALFNGSSVLEAGTDNLPYSNSPFTLSFFMRPTSSPSVDTGVFAFGKDSNGCLISVVYSNGVISLASHGGGWGQGSSTQITWDNTMKHIAFVVGQGDTDNRPLSVYLNGVKVTDTYLRMSGFASDFKMYIGSYWGNADYIPNFTGYLSSLRIYDRTLAQDEISTLASEFAASDGSVDNTQSNVPEGVVFYDALSEAGTWEFENDASIVDDTNRKVFNVEYGESYAVIRNNPGNLPLDSSARSMSHWFKSNGENTGAWCGIGYGTSGSNNRYTWGIYDGMSSFTFWAQDIWESLPPEEWENYGIDNGEWHHVVTTFDGDETVKQYIDGELVWTWSVWDVHTSFECIHVGDPWEWYAARGRYADLYIYNRVLSQDEIEQLYAARTV